MSSLLYYLIEKSSIDLSGACHRYVPIILHVSIEISQFEEYRIVIVSRCLVLSGANIPSPKCSEMTQSRIEG